MSGNPFGTAVVQMQPKSGDVQSNLKVIEASSRRAADRGATLVIVPELATTGYLLDERIAELAETIPGATSARLCDIARENSVYLVCGIIERDGGGFFNSALLCAPDGQLLAAYRKLHPS
ncbi:MAG: carbon-nitrogen hydrolase family protein, partial [Chloroflexi bacterium]|nr:carbon-nitrogen hydrolase family protein [Chloroflexota bacterium]